MNPLLWYLFLSCYLYIAGSFLGAAECRSRGKGTWYRDREYLRLQGAAYALSLVCGALFIDQIINAL
jgi:hypothetical protein